MQRFQTVGEVMASYPGRFYPDRAEGVEGVVQFIFTGEEGGTYYLAIDGRALEVVQGDHPDPAVTVTVPAADWLQVNNGDTSPMGLLIKGRLKVRGSLALATKFQQLFRPGSEL